MNNLQQAIVLTICVFILSILIGVPSAYLLLDPPLNDTETTSGFIEEIIPLPGHKITTVEDITMPTEPVLTITLEDGSVYTGTQLFAVEVPAGTGITVSCRNQYSLVVAYSDNTGDMFDSTEVELFVTTDSFVLGCMYEDTILATANIISVYEIPTGIQYSTDDVRWFYVNEVPPQSAETISFRCLGAPEDATLLLLHHENRDSVRLPQYGSIILNQGSYSLGCMNEEDEVIATADFVVGD